MPKTREQKREIIRKLEKIFSAQGAKILIDFSGLNSEELLNFKRRLREINCSLTVAKKTLLGKVLEKLGRNDIAKTIMGIKRQIAMVFGEQDKITKAKACNELAKNSSADILGGIEGDGFIPRETVLELAKLPSAGEIRTRLVASLKSPIAGLANALIGNIKGLLVSLNAIKESKQNG